MPRDPAQRRRAEASLAAVTLLWGASFTLVKSALEDVSTVLFLAMRFSLAALVLLAAWRRAAAAGPETRAGVRAGILAGLCLTAAYALQTSGLRLTTASKSAFVTALNVPLVPLIGAVVYWSVPRRLEIAAAAAAIAGTALLTLPEGGLTWNLGDLLTVGCAAAFSAHILVVGHFAPRVSIPALSLTQIVTVALLMTVAAPWAEPLHLRWSFRLAAAVVVTGVLATALAFSVQAWAQQETTATRTALIFAIEPVAAAATAWLVAGESLTSRGLCGAALILAAVLAAELKPPRLQRHP